MNTTRIAALLALVAATAAQADEGMWTLDNFPAGRVDESYGVDVTAQWLDEVRLATTRIEGGCTGSFASPDGLVLTNHHCVRRCISQISSAERDAEELGFLAHSRADEPRCQAEQISVLMEMEDVTADIAQATSGKSEQDANKARKTRLTELEQACERKSDGKLTCESVTLYGGGQYFVYKYKRYDDVRLVFAPEAPIAAFGGDPDNFNFPRWCLDMSFLRVYENGAPAATPNYLRWRQAGASENEPVFVSGHPGSTDRKLSVAELRSLRDIDLPVWLLRYSELRGRLIQFGKGDAESRRIVQQPLMGIENAIKVRRNEQSALLGDVMRLKADDERALREAVAADPALQEAYGSAWGDMERAMQAYSDLWDVYLFSESGAAFSTVLFSYARSLLRAGDEREKPNGERLREFTDPALPQLRQRILAARPVYPEMETVRLSYSLEKMREWLGPDDAFVKDVLGNDSPDEMAEALIAGTRLGDPEYRKALWEGGRAAVEASDDPMIQLARRVDPDARAIRKRHEDEVEAPRRVASEKIAAARFAVYGTETYPDGTFTLRLTYGKVTGWQERGEYVYPFTTVERLFERATGADPFRLPATWLQVQDTIPADTRFNFVATTDITGGNSGSPIIDAEGRLVGLAFDGNVHSIAGSYWYDGSMNRTVGVHPAIMLRALSDVYGADKLIDELDVR